MHFRPAVPYFAFIVGVLFLEPMTIRAQGQGIEQHGIERQDENSRIAHKQLLEKAKKGRIDVYFVGDSITRRWGATDYPQFLEHWKKCFHGWNAANFGWGGDTAENVLWRLENGELDDVHPKVIIVQVGTNNLSRPPIDDKRKLALETTIVSILKVCQQKAPKAKVILFGIFPRTDMSLSSEDLKDINARLEKQAAAHHVTFRSINDQLLDKEGVLRKDVTVDGLHLSLKGYQIWADDLTPILETELGPKQSNDTAPPPTGDPKAARK